MKKLFLHAIVFFPVWVFSQSYAPQFKSSVQINNDSSSVLTDFQVLVYVNTLDPITQGHMRVDGGDIRFTNITCTPSIFMDYWIESGLNTDSTRIWVKVPFLNSSSTTEILMWYGDSTSTTLSDFNSTFPNAFISSGHDTILSGSIYYDWFQLDSGDVIFLEQNQPLEINARSISIRGKFEGRGMGHKAPLTVNVGNGPGGGGMSITSGAGGGSYGGFGGAGGYDLGDMPGNGGPMYGNVDDQTFFTGSSGGSTDNAPGGNGGGAVKLSAEWINIGGEIDMSGNEGVGLTGRCGGGGSGGSIVILGENVNVLAGALLSVKGGDGGDGNSAAHDGGGGGSGGRVKFFYKNYSSINGNIDYTGGVGGMYGTVSFGIFGGTGSYIDTTCYFASVTSIISAELSLLEAKILNLDSFYCLNKDTVNLFANPSGGTFAGTGVSGDYFFPLEAGVGIHQITYTYIDPWGCGVLYDTATVEVLNIPTFPFAWNNSPLCSGSTILLSASDSLAQHLWTGPGGFTSTHQNPIIPSASTSDGGAYSVTITNASGCSSTVVTHVVVNTAPSVIINSNSPLCAMDDLLLSASGGNTYSWTGPNGFNSSSQNPTLVDAPTIYNGTYSVTVTGPNGCISTATTMAEINGCYDNTEEHPDENIMVYPNPTVDELWLDIKDQTNLNNYSFIFTDMRGRVLMTGAIELNNIDRFSIRVSDFDRGSYILIINDGSRNKNMKVILN